MPAESAAVLAALYTSAPIGLAYWGPDLRFRRINARLAEMNGLAAEDHLGRTPSELFGDLGAGAEARLREVFHSREPLLDVEVSGELPAGRRRDWLVSYYPVPGPGGDLLGVGAVVLEITEQVAAAERERRARDKAEVLARSATALAGTIDLETVVRRLTTAAVPHLADWCAIHLAEPTGSPRLAAVAHADPAREALAWELNERYPPDPRAPTGAAAVLRSGEPEIYFELPQDVLRAQAQDAQHARILDELQLRSALVLPLRARRSVLGVLTLVMAESGRNYTEDLVEVAESIATQAALALDNARLYAEQVEIARTLQRSLLPAELPEVEGVDVAARYRPAGRSNEVGGDFYDLFESATGEWTFLVGDVVGKGAPAAALTALVRNTAEAASLRGETPEESMGLINDALLRRATSHEFCSAVYGRICRMPGGGAELRVISAGHPPPLVVRAGGAVEEVPSGGPLLGITPDPRYEARALELAPGDALVLYTDGVVELRGTSSMEGERALRAVLGSCNGARAHEIAERVEHHALMRGRGEPRDDIAVLVLRPEPSLDPPLEA